MSGFVASRVLKAATVYVGAVSLKSTRDFVVVSGKHRDSHSL
jgi:hypothetical protein